MKFLSDIPVLPNCMEQVLQSFMPFIVGMHASIRDRTLPQDVVRVDLDHRNLAGIGLCWPNLDGVDLQTYNSATVSTTNSGGHGHSQSLFSSPVGASGRKRMAVAAEWTELAPVEAIANAQAYFAADADIVLELQIPILSIPTSLMQRLAHRLKNDSAAVFQPDLPPPAQRLATGGDDMLNVDDEVDMTSNIAPFDQVIGSMLVQNHSSP